MSSLEQVQSVGAADGLIGLQRKLSTTKPEDARKQPRRSIQEWMALAALLGANLTLNLWNLGINGWANSFYSAAVQSGTKDWESFFFGSSDWGNSITVDKPPLSLWLMGLSVRLFGFSPASIVIPQALLGVGTTLFIYLILRRHCGMIASVVGAVVFFTTPIVALMSRYNNPDPLMLFLMSAAAYLVITALESGRTRTIALAGALLGLAFMTKQLQGLMNLPVLALAFLLYSQLPMLRRLGALAIAALTTVVFGTAWMLIVDLLPASSRPFVGGSSTNSVLQLTMGYNGLDRITGNEDPTASLIPAQFRPVATDAGVLRLLNANYGQEASWLLVAGIFAAVVLLVARKRLGEAKGLQATILVSTLWLIIVFLVLSFMGQQIHTYYTAALGPPLALTIGLGAQFIITTRGSARYRMLSSVIAFLGITTSWLLLNATVGWPQWLPVGIFIAGTTACVALFFPAPHRRVPQIAGGLLATVLIIGPLATSIYSTGVPQTGSNPLSGRLSVNESGISHFLAQVKENRPPWAHDIAMGRDPSPELEEKIKHAPEACTWAAATYASQTAAKLQLATDRPVMPLGGFAGKDPSPTLERFQQLVAEGRVCYFVWQDDFLSAVQEATTVQTISRWVKDRFESETLGGTTVYNLRRAL
ncbi:glycosyltransferase family 39 protein [Arthrobacter sp. M4]|uniref:ArnT family glycosyltransferase n=1 Tax=Arthrobacter sp. M4 TaxID=218160 RepID=UPI001CDD66C0|nr:glycosyltransferase family 39 protein [Arthrobacter sp. M4]MCA4135119.1 glycosyltransferase family 39 protein [Arthrobacter sp. M4]